jgi:hypothetical protein
MDGAAGAVDQEIIVKKLTIRKLILGRETVKTLLTGVPGGRLRDVRGGFAVPDTDPNAPSKGDGCSGGPPRCPSIVWTLNES